MATFTVRNLEGFNKLFASLAAKAKRFGLTVPSYTVLGTRVEKAEVISGSGSDWFVSQGEPVDVIVHDIEVTGDQPVEIAGWSFAAKIEHLDKGNLVKALPGLQTPERYRTSRSVCEHCGVYRNRNYTFLVRNGDEFKQVGTTCLHDFLGLGSAETLAGRFSFTGFLNQSIKEYCDNEPTSPDHRAWSLLNTVATSLAVTRAFGWVSATKAKEGGGASTASLVLAKAADPTPDDYESAKAMILAMAGHTGSSDYENNLVTLARTGYHSASSHALACSLPVGYANLQRTLSREQEAEQRRQTSQHLGKPGDRIKVNGTVTLVTGWPSQFGWQVMTIVTDDQGNVIKAKELGVSRGDRVSFVATVKEHTEYDQVCQTAVIRASKITITPANATAA